MKKLISLGIVSAMVASMSSIVSFAATDASSNNITKMFALWNGRTTLGRTIKASGRSSDTNGLLTAKPAGTSVNGITMNENYYLLEGNNTDTVRLIFGSSSTTLVADGNGARKGDNYRGITPLKSSVGNLSYDKDKNTKSTLISISKGTYSVNVGSGEYKYALGFEIKFNNKGNKEAYAMYDLTVAGKTFKVVAHSIANDTSDTSAVDNDRDENGIIPYGGTDANFANGTVIYTKALREMYDQGETYGIQMRNGVDVIVSKVMKATPDAGTLTLNYNIGKDANLNDRYASIAGGNLLSLDVVSGFVNEKIRYNIDLSNSEVSNIITETQLDRWSDGKKVYVYVVNKDNLNTAASASTTDGIINSEKMIVGNITDGKVVFDVPAKYFDNTKEKLMISLKEIDTATLPAIPGVSIPEDVTSSANEITAPVIADTETSVPTITAPVVSTPVLETAPAGTNTGVQNTGAKDVKGLCAAIAVMAIVAAAGTTVSKKSFKKF